MNSTADFVYHFVLPDDPHKARIKTRWRLRQMRREGATWPRLTHEPDDPRLMTLEGWRVKPAYGEDGTAPPFPMRSDNCQGEKP